MLEPDQSVRAEVIQMDAAERRIGLSIKSARRQDELADAQGFTKRQPGRGHARRVMADKLRAAQRGGSKEE